MKIIPIIVLLVQLFKFIVAYNPYLDTAAYVLGSGFYESLSFSTIAIETTIQEDDNNELNKKVEYEYDPEQFGDYDDEDNDSYDTVTSMLHSSSIITSLTSTKTATANSGQSVSLRLTEHNYQTIILWNTDAAASSLNTEPIFSSKLQNNTGNTNDTVKGSRLGNLTSEVTSEIQNKSVLKFVTGVGEFICGFFVICSIVDTAVNLGIDIGEAITGKEKALNEIIRNSTKLVEIR